MVPEQHHLPVPPLISLLTDFGTRDPWVAVCKGVILAIAPDVRIVDVTHDVAAFDVREGSLTLAAVVPWLPVGIQVAVVDPGVGTERRGVGVRTARGDVLVGPDNGILLPAAAALGGIAAVHELSDPRWRRDGGGRTFHARDVFAPAAAHLAAGVPLEEFGPSIGAAGLVALDVPRAVALEGRLRSPVLGVDTFGNVALAGSAEDLAAAIGKLNVGDPLQLVWMATGGLRGETIARWATTFGDVDRDEWLIYEDSLGHLAVAVNLGHAANRLGLPAGGSVEVSRSR
jgi:S-adenosylmethionine hydrolase